MKKLLLSLAVITTGFMAQAQIIVAGISPANISGNYSFTWGDPGGGDWATPDFETPGTFVQGQLMLVEDGTAGTNAQGNPISQEGCNALTNDLTGKIAILYRNTCEFGKKAKNAQTAGAIGVIIVNRDPEAIGMGGGADGTSVTIPVVMVSSTDGAILINEMGNGPVTMFLGNKSSLFGDDIGSNRDFILGAPFGSNTNLIADHSFELGIQIYNFGSNMQSNVNVTATIDGPSGNVYTDVVGPLTMNAGDTVAIFDGFVNSFTPLSLMNPAVGEYTLTYSIDLGGTADESDFDNVFSAKFHINENVISLARLNEVTGFPIANTYPSNTDGEYQSCMMYQHSNASQLGVNGFFVVPHADTATADLAGAEINAIVYTWDDAWTDLNDPAYEFDPTTNDAYQNLTAISIGSYSPLSNDETDQPAYIELNNQVGLVDNQRYLMCLQSFDPAISFGYDNELKYRGNYNVLLQPVGPILVVDGTPKWYTAAWSGTSAASLGLDVFPSAELGIKEPTAMLKALAYPNPVKDVVTISIDITGNAKLKVTDISGKVVFSDNVSFNSGITNVNTSSLESGMYIFNIELENGQTSQLNIVKK